MGSLYHTYDLPPQIIHGVLDSLTSPVEDVGIDYGCSKVFIPKKFLGGPNVTDCH